MSFDLFGGDFECLRFGECFVLLFVSLIFGDLRGDFELSFGDVLCRFNDDGLRCRLDDFLRSIIINFFWIEKQKCISQWMN